MNITRDVSVLVRIVRGRRADLESGQVLVIFALLLSAMVAMLGMVVDLGVLLGQRRFNQNAADAAAMSASRLLADAVVDEDLDAGTVYFDADDVAVFRTVRRFAGLSPDDLSSIASTGVNQHSGLRDRTKLLVTLEYSDGAQWCRSPASPATLSGAPVCGLHAGIHPPAPTPEQHYRVRVTVHSATVSFLPALGPGAASCLRPDGAPGALGCASATVVLGGPCPPCAITYD